MSVFRSRPTYRLACSCILQDDGSGDLSFRVIQMQSGRTFLPIKQKSLRRKWESILKAIRLHECSRTIG